MDTNFSTESNDTNSTRSLADAAPWGKVAGGAALLLWGLGGLSLGALVRGVALAAGGTLMYRTAKEAGLLSGALGSPGSGDTGEPLDQQGTEVAAGRLATAWGARSNVPMDVDTGVDSSATSGVTTGLADVSAGESAGSMGAGTSGGAGLLGGSDAAEPMTTGGSKGQKQGLVDADVPPPIDLRGA